MGIFLGDHQDHRYRHPALVNRPGGPRPQRQPGWLFIHCGMDLKRDRVIDCIFDLSLHGGVDHDFFPLLLPAVFNSVGIGQRCPGDSNSWVFSGPQVPAA